MPAGLLLFFLAGLIVSICWGLGADTPGKQRRADWLVVFWAGCILVSAIYSMIWEGLNR